MPKLHELLAIESSLETQAAKVRSELSKTFTSKHHLFEEKMTTFQPNEEGKPLVIEAQSKIQSSVASELDWVSKHIEKALDAGYQIAEANTIARADIILDDDKGTIIAKNIPATSLLELEKRLVEIRELLASAPTLDPAKNFQPDAAKGVGLYKARPVTKNRTRKDKRVIVKYEATDKHPAQTELIDEDRVVGTISEEEWSGMITPAVKSEILDRAERLIRAVRAARSRANNTETDPSKKLGYALLSFILRDGR